MSMIISGNTSISGNCVISQKLLLDDITNDQFVYLLNKVKTDYTGMSLRVRRLSDEVEEEFGFVGGRTNFYGINKFAPGGYKVSRFYNQGLYGGYLEQATALVQPTIEIAAETGLETFKFTSDGESMYQSLPDVASIFVNDLHFFSPFIMRAYNPSGNEAYVTITCNEKEPYVIYHYSSYYAGTPLYGRDKYILKASGGYTTDWIQVDSMHSLDDPVLVTHSRTGATMYTRKNGVQTATGVGSAGPLEFGTNPILIFGARNYANPFQNSNGFVWCNAYLPSNLEQKVERGLINLYS